MTDWYNYDVHMRLIEAAKTEEDFVRYGEIIEMAGLGSRFSGQALSGALGHVFYAIVKADREVDSNRPMLSAVALPTNESVPSRGFFELAIDLGLMEPGGDELAFWLNELAALRVYWGSHST